MGIMECVIMELLVVLVELFDHRSLMETEKMGEA